MVSTDYEVSIYISMYFGIGLVLTLIMYKPLVLATIQYIENNSYIFSAYTQDELNTLVNTTVSLCLFIWPFVLASMLVYKLEQLLNITYK
jgi:hypothetical protein